MENHEKDAMRREEVRRQKYKVGQTTDSSQGYHILNAGYNQSS
jgi:hypothetical protein